MSGQEDEYEIDLDVLRHHVADGNFALRPQAMQHAVKEGFNEEAMLQGVLHGAVVESYPERNRCFLFANVTIEGVLLLLHVVCEHLYSDAPVDFVTAYIPLETEWETPTRRRKRS
jgi:hypothetical protein